jgi:SprB repeat
MIHNYFQNQYVNNLKSFNKGFRQLDFSKIITYKVIVFLLLLLPAIQSNVYGQTSTPTTIQSGSFIIDMGVVPQTEANGLKPYGLIYDLLKNYKVPVNWVINSGKVKDGTDFTYNSIAYKGGPFIIEAQYRTAAVNAAIANWQAQGVVGITTTSPVTVPVYLTFYNAPAWTMDQTNGAIAVGFFTPAGIPSSAYGGSSKLGWKLPSELTCCDDIFVMPHANPIWSTHQKLFDWVNGSSCKGGVWLGCHAGSALMNMFDNVTPDYTKQANFLVDKTGNATGVGPYATAPGNSLILWGNHTNGTPPYSYDHSDEPIMQFMGTVDAAMQNGSEQIYIPVGGQAGWFPNAHVGVYDPDHAQIFGGANGLEKYRAAAMVYGPANGVATNGRVMLEASHSITGNGSASVAAIRAFLNYSFLVGWEKSVLPEMSTLSGTLLSGSSYSLSFTPVPVLPPAPVQTYTLKWSSSCGGTFLPNDTASTVTFIPPAVVGPTTCNIGIELSDSCGRKTFDTQITTVQCDFSAATTITSPCFGTSNGAITMSSTNGVAPYNYTWTKSGGGTGSGTLSTAPYSITGLSAGTYNVTLTSNGGAGCAASFAVTLTDSPQIIMTATPVAVKCPGGSDGAINVAVSGGTPGYTYSWTASAGGTIPSGQATNMNLNNLIAGTYNLTVTDSKGCTATTSQSITQPASIVVTPVITTVDCRGSSTGAIALTIAGGTAPYTYLWNDGNTSQNRTGLAAGTFSVTVTDANNCTRTQTGIAVTQPAAVLTLSHTQTNILINGASTGAINLTATGGTSPYTYAWTGAGVAVSSEDQTGLAAGVYSVTVTDTRGCTANLSVTLTQPPPMLLSTVITNPLCPPGAQVNGNTGAIDLSVSGGVPGYTYDWSDIGTPGVFTDPQDRTSIPAGTYTVVVRDANGATQTTTVTLTNINPNPATPTTITH